MARFHGSETCCAVKSEGGRCTRGAADDGLCGIHRTSVERGTHTRVDERLVVPTRPLDVGQYVSMGQRDLAMLDAVAGISFDA